MLALSRRNGESIIIEHGGEIIKFTIMGAAKVRIAFDAPKSFRIHREEVFEKYKLPEKKIDDTHF